MKDTKIDKIIRYGAYAAGAYFLGITIAGAIKRKRADGTNGIGATDVFRYSIYVIPNGTNKKVVYGTYETEDEAIEALRLIPHEIRRSCNYIHLIDNITGKWT